MKKILLSLVLCLCIGSNVIAQSKFKNIKHSNIGNVDVNKIVPVNPLPESIPSASNLFDQNINFKPMNQMHLPVDKNGGPKVSSWSASGLPLWIEGRSQFGITEKTDKELMAKQYLNVMAKPMQIRNAENEFVLKSITTDINQVDHLTFDQYYNSIPVYGGQYKVHLDANGPYMANGRYYPTPKLKNLQPTISADAANDLVKNDVSRITKFKVLPANELQYVENHQQFTTQLVIYHVKNNSTLERLCWHIQVYPNMIKRYEYFIDAMTGEILNSFNNLCGVHDNHEVTCGDPLDGAKTANAIDLNNTSRTIDTYQVGSTYYMEDASKSMFKAASSTMPNSPDGAIVTLDGLNNSPSSQNFNYTLVSSNNNTWSDKASVSAHYNASQCYKYYLSTHNRIGVDGKGGNILSFVNISDDNGGGLDNAYWNGAAMFYGNGAVDFKPLAGGLDVGGHEMSHGVVGTTANLEYQGESGALNESYADVFGAMIERLNWTMGETVVKLSSFPSGALRSFSDPHNGGSSLNDPGWQPKHVNEKYNGTQDNGGVHINSGIPNYAFYLFTTSAGVTKEISEKVYYKALTDYLVKSSIFIDERAAVIQAAKDLYGAASPIVTAAANAFTSVGIGSGGDPGGTSYLKDLPVNPGNDFIVATDESFANVYLASGNNFSTIQQISSISPANKFSVTDDGSAIVYVGTDKKIHAIIINYSNGTVQESLVSNDAIWSNVAISKDGKRIAAITNEGKNEIWIYDFTIQSWKSFTLYNPTYSTGVTTGDVEYPDVIEWDYSGNYVMYDALNQIKDANNNKIEYWDISFLRAFDKKTTQYGDGQISKLFNGLAENTSIGNPSFSKNSPYIIGFDFIDETANQNSIVNANIETGDYGFIINQGEIAYPCFSRLDDYLIFNTPTDLIGFAKLGTNKISYGNSNGTLFNQARWGNWFANGKRDINIATNEQFATKQSWTLYPTLTSGQIRLTALETTEKGLIQIFDELGRQVIADELDATQVGSQQNLEVSKLSTGNYFVRIQAGKTIQTSRFIKN